MWRINRVQTPNYSITVPWSSTDKKDKSAVSGNRSGSISHSAASAMGGEDGPADVAVGRHGGQLPPRGNNRRRN